MLRSLWNDSNFQTSLVWWNLASSFRHHSGAGYGTEETESRPQNTYPRVAWAASLANQSPQIVSG